MVEKKLKMKQKKGGRSKEGVLPLVLLSKVGGFCAVICVAHTPLTRDYSGRTFENNLGEPSSPVGGIGGGEEEGKRVPLETVIPGGVGVGGSWSNEGLLHHPSAVYKGCSRIRKRREWGREEGK